MARFHACSVDVIAKNAVRRFEPPQRPGIALYNLAGEFFATDDACSHKWASLSMGDIHGQHIICPWHGGAFDIRTGAACSAPCVTSLSTYRVVIENDQIFVIFD